MLVCVPPSGSLTAGELSHQEREGSYPEFLERRALGEGSYRRFFGREFAEPAACEGRLAKGNKV